MLQPGDFVLVETVRGDDVDAAEVLSALSPADLPDLAGDRLAAKTRAILAAWHVDEIAVLKHRLDSPAPLAFVALRIGARWYDLQRSELRITRKQAVDALFRLIDPGQPRQ